MGASTGELVRLFLKLGFSGFGGPLAHIGMMQAEVVERRRWLTKEQFLEGLAVCQMLPGPASTQLGLYIGYTQRGLAGGLVTGLAFVLPGFLIILTLSWLYGVLGSVPRVQGIFAGINPAVVAIIVHACYRLGRSAITDLPLLVLAAGAFVLTAVLDVDVVVTLLLAGLVGIALYGLPRRAGGAFLLAGVAPVWGVWGNLAYIFAKAGAFVYGGGYVIIPFVQREVVERLGWMSVRTFLDGIALGQITPGPIVNISAFVGYQAAGVPGAALAAASVFLPAFAFILAAAPLMARLREAPRIKAFLTGVNAAVVGAILGATVPLARGALVNVPSALIAVGAYVLLWRYKVDTVYLVIASGLLGLALSFVS